MRIKVNGADRDVGGQLSISELLAENKVEQPDMVSVQLNGEFVERGNFSSVLVKENDEVDFLYFMGGGL
ncbi:MAG: sulfur carrier protein ThiS [Victivallales bacterium]